MAVTFAVMRRLGSTLIELLVVVAIITLLLAILFPSLRYSREQARTVVCSSNVKQLTFGLAAYETENGTFPHALDETLLKPPPGGFPGNPMHDRVGWWWFNYTTAYSKRNSGKSSVILCPSRTIPDGTLRNDVLCGNYGVNRSVCKAASDRLDRSEFAGKPLAMADVSSPSETLVIMDSGYSMISWWHVTDVPPVSLGATIEDTAYVPGLEMNKGKSLWPGQEWDAVNGRHPNKTVNVGFTDGHTHRANAEDLFVEKLTGGYRNVSPLWKRK